METQDMFGATEFEILLSHLRLSLYNEGLLEQNEETLERLHAWVDKTIPKKPIVIQQGIFTFFKCQDCGHLVGPTCQFCSHCARAVNREDIEQISKNWDLYE